MHLHRRLSCAVHALSHSRTLALSHSRTFALSHLLFQARREGLEPPTPGFGDQCSTVELPPCVYICFVFREGEERTFRPCRAPPTGVACHAALRTAAVRPALSSREPFTRTHDPSCQTCRAARARRRSSRRLRFTGCAGVSSNGKRKAPRLPIAGGRGARCFRCARSGCGCLLPQRTSSRESFLILPMPLTAGARAPHAAESIAAIATAHPADEGRGDNPTETETLLRVRRQHGRRARLRLRPERQRRGGGHGRHVRHPEGGGGEGGGHLEIFLCSSVVRFTGSPGFG